MRCRNREIKELLPLYREQALDGPDALRVQDHLAGCADCRLELSLLAVMAAEPVPDPGDAFWAGMPARIHGQVLAQRERRRERGLAGALRHFFLHRGAWAAAAVVVLAMLSVLLVRPGPETPQVASAPSVLGSGDEDLADDGIDLAALSDAEIGNVDSWAEQEMTALAVEAEPVAQSEDEEPVSEELAELDTRSLERLSRMLDDMTKGGWV